MKEDDALRSRVDRLERIVLAHFAEENVYRRAICNLIATHHDPLGFAVQFADVMERTFAIQLNDPEVSDAQREAAQRLSKELCALAQAAHHQRQGQMPPR